MNSYKHLLLIIAVSFSFSQKNHAVITDVKPDAVKLWEVDDNNINNPELKKALEQLRMEFEEQRNEIQSNYKIRINELKQQKDSNIEILKKQFVEKRNSLKEKYGLKDLNKPKKLKATKKDENLSKKKPEKVNYINKSPVKKTTKKSPASSLEKKSNSEKVESKDKK